MKSPPLLSVSPTSGLPLAEQLHRQFTWLLASGQWQKGDRLPSIRALADQLGINMHTVRSAYLRLEAEGWVQTRRGAGTHVLEVNPRTLHEAKGRTRSYTIGIILPGMSNPFYHEFLQGVEQGISSEHLLLFVCDAHDDPQEFLRDYAQLSTRDVDGIIVASFDLHPSLGKPDPSGIPLVTVDWPGCPGPVVNFDLEEAAWQAVHHLLSHGFHRIGMITNVGDQTNVAQVNAGYIRAIQEAGMKMDENLISRVPGFDITNGESGAHILLNLAEPPEAIFTIADTLALGALRTLKSEGKKVPGDIAIASLDDISISGMVDPGLTTVSLPARELGLRAMDMLLTLISGEQLKVKAVTLPTRLIIRQSCGCKP